MVNDQRGLGKQIKRVLPESIFRWATVSYNAMMAGVPYGVKYGIAGVLRTLKYPYCVIEDGDTVVQIGAPSDTLAAGRSRAIHFARMVGRGIVVVLEPDPDNCSVLEAFIEQTGLADRIRLVRVAAWKEKTELMFFSSRTHPASNVVVDVKDITREIEMARGYERIRIPVDTVDNVLAETGARPPKLVSITTNGAEKQVLEGMKETLEAGVPYISLASTQRDLLEHMLQLKNTYAYEYIARDDRGYCFRKIMNA